MRRLPLEEHRMSGWHWMRLATPFMVVRRIALSHAWWSSNNVPPYIFSLSSTLKNVLFVIFITFGHPFFNCIKLQLFIFSIASFVI
jgi:hypothetical protein